MRLVHGTCRTSGVLVLGDMGLRDLPVVLAGRALRSVNEPDYREEVLIVLSGGLSA